MLCAVSVLCLGGAIFGAYVSLRSFSSQTVQTKFADVDTHSQLSREGNLHLRVPVLDWGVQAATPGVPISVEAEIRKLDRKKASTALGPDPDAPRETLSQVQADGRTVLEKTYARAALCAALGALVGGLLTGALVGSVVRKRRWLIVGTAIGLMIPLVAAPGVYKGLDRIKQQRLATTVDYTGQAQELSRVIAFAEQLLFVKDDYSALYKRALGSAQNVMGFTRNTKSSGKAESSFLVASDLHDNVLILPAFDRFAGDRTVFMSGDFGQVGAKIEQRLAPQVAELGGRVVAVSGNHDSQPFMQSLAAEGVTVLTSKGTLQGDGSVNTEQLMVTVGGMRVAGYSDPLEAAADDHEHVLRVHGDKYEKQARDLIKWFDALPQTPDVLLIHQHGLAHRLLEHLNSEGLDERVIVITGHDHQAHAEQSGKQILIDGGTLGAGGPFAIGEQPAAFAQVDVRRARATSADLVAINPLTGAAAVRHVQFAGSQDRAWRADEVGALVGFDSPRPDDSPAA